MKKRIFAILLTLCMVLSLLPVTAWAGEAAGTMTGADFVAKATEVDGVNMIKLTNDVKLSTTANIDASVTIDLNGHTIKSASLTTPIFNVGANATLTIDDTSNGDVGGVINDNGKMNFNIETGPIFGTVAGTVIIKAGKYSEPIPTDYLAEGLVNNADDWFEPYTITKDAAEVEITYWANGENSAIEGVYQYSSEESGGIGIATGTFVAANTRTATATTTTIKLLTDLTVTNADGQLAIASPFADPNTYKRPTVILDLNGCTITGNWYKNLTYQTPVQAINSIVIIRDSGSGGTITSNSDIGTIAAIGNSLIQVESGIIENSASGSGKYAVYTPANLSGYEATFADDYGVTMDKNKVTPGTIEISGGTIKGTVYQGGKSTISISGGTFTGELIASDSSNPISITGGTFSKKENKKYLAEGYAFADNKNGTYTVYIPATGLSLDKTSAAVTYGETLTLKATKTPDNATNAVTWTSDDETIATVSSKGVVTPVKAGTATITASVDGKTATCDVMVNPKETALTLTPSVTSLEGGGTVTLTLDSGEAAAKDVTVKCSDTSITVTPNSDGTYTATLPNATVNYTFTASLTSAYYTAKDATATVSVTRYVAATTGTTTTTTNKTETTTETLPAETGETANTQVGEAEEPVEVVSTETVTDEATGTVTTTTEKSDGSTTVVEEKTDGTVTTTDTGADGAVKSVEQKPDGTVTTTAKATNGVEAVTVAAPGKQVTAKVTIPEEVEKATVTIPADLTAGMVAMDADTGEIIMLSVLTDDGMAVKLDSSANIILVDNSTDFADVDDDHWASDAVDFATAHELFNGTGEDTFTPDGDMTRAMLMTVLARFDGVDTDSGATWYEAGMNWAVENEISDGSDPDASITREQLATMLYRYAGSPKVDGTITGFSDADDISSYAADAMAWAIQTGILTGNTRGELNPSATASRAQVAAMLMRLCAALV